MSTDICECGHGREVHGFGMGECWECALKAQWASEECDRFRAAADRAEASDV